MIAAETILVTGSSGALGRLVVETLRERRATVIAGSRRPDSSGSAARLLDFDDAASLENGFSGIGRALIVSTDVLLEPGRRLSQHHAAIDAARAAGVRFLAYTSMPHPDSSPAIFFAPDHAATEAALAESGVPHGVLRNGWYQENLLAYLPQIIADGTWFSAAGEGRIPHVARADAATAAADMLLSASTGIFDIAGPRALTNREIAAAVETVLGRRLTVVDVDATRLGQELARQGVAGPMIAMVAATEASQRDGRFEVPDGAFARLTGHAATPIEAFLRANADALLSRVA